jgi:hypothetical protein
MRITIIPAIASPANTVSFSISPMISNAIHSAYMNNL